MSKNKIEQNETVECINKYRKKVIDTIKKMNLEVSKWELDDQKIFKETPMTITKLSTIIDTPYNNLSILNVDLEIDLIADSIEKYMKYVYNGYTNVSINELEKYIKKLEDHILHNLTNIIKSSSLSYHNMSINEYIKKIEEESIINVKYIYDGKFKISFRYDSDNNKLFPTHCIQGTSGRYDFIV